MAWTEFDTYHVILVLEWIFILYFLMLHGVQVLLTTISMKGLGARMESVAVRMLPRLSAGFEIPVSIVVPVTENPHELGNFVQALFNLDYPQFEIVVVDDTPDGIALAQLQSVFDLVVFPEVHWRQVRARALKTVYRSARFPSLRVMDKISGGPGDAINAGVNAARYPIVCIVQPDCVLRRDSLRRLAQMFSEDSTTVAAGVGERFTNGRFVVNGFLERCRLPAKPLAWPGITASLRRNLCSRQGWDSYNATLAFAEGFCAFRKEAMVQAGGCLRTAVNPVWELLVRIHRLYLGTGKPYRTTFLPAPVVWRVPPSAPKQLCAEAAKEHRGLSDALRTNRELSRMAGSGVVGRLAYPYITLTEAAGPAIEIGAFAFFLSAFMLGIISTPHFVAFLVASVGLGILLSWMAIVLDGFVFGTYRNPGSYVLLAIAAVIENAGFRQGLALCKIISPLFGRNRIRQSQQRKTD